MNEILAKALSAYFYNAKDAPGEHKKILGIENIDKVIDIDQSPIGRTPEIQPGHLHRRLYIYPRPVCRPLRKPKCAATKPEDSRSTSKAAAAKFAAAMA
jgi:hypothetical protein